MHSHNSSHFRVRPRTGDRTPNSRPALRTQACALDHSTIRPTGAVLKFALKSVPAFLSDNVRWFSLMNVINSVVLDVCANHEHFTECGPANPRCEPICGQSPSSDESCDECGDAGCLCDDGYIRSGISGDCILMDNCPSSINDDNVLLLSQGILRGDILPSNGKTT